MMYFAPSVWSRRYGQDFFTASIVGFSLEEETEGFLPCLPPSKFASFGIKISIGEDDYMLNRRTRDFVALDRRIQQVYSSKVPLPVPPPKTFFCSTIDPESRQAQLSSMLDQILNQFNVQSDNETISSEVKTFLELKPTSVLTPH